MKSFHLCQEKRVALGNTRKNDEASGALYKEIDRLESLLDKKVIDDLIK